MPQTQQPPYASTLLLEEWLSRCSGTISTSLGQLPSSSSSSSSSARAIIQAWADLRDVLHSQQSFLPKLLHSLKTLHHSRSSLFVSDPQAKLLISILSSPSSSVVSLTHESCPFFFSLLYIWVRKSSKPSPTLIDSAVHVVSRLLRSDTRNRTSFFIAQAVLLLGAISCVPTTSETSKSVCLELLRRVLEQEHHLIQQPNDTTPEVVAGIGYALSSSEKAHFSRILGSLLEIWGKDSCVSTGLMILHVIEWALSGFISLGSLGKIEVLTGVVFNLKAPPKQRGHSYAPFALVMAAGGILRASIRSTSSSNLKAVNIIPRLRLGAEEIIEHVARSDLKYITGAACLPSLGGDDPADSFLLQCVSLALVRSGPISCSPPVFKCLASALLTEIFPLKRFYTSILDEYAHGNGNPAQVGIHHKVKEHLDNVIFKESGAATSVFCNQYVLVDEEHKGVVENFIWSYCQDIYFWHRQVALVLRGEEDGLLADLETIVQSAFLMVVVFALTVAKTRLTPYCTQKLQMEVSVQILVSLSCLEYFRHVRLAEYMDTIQAVVVSVQENEDACASFVKSMPSYLDLTKQQGSSSLLKEEYSWFEDHVQTARVSFYLRVIPTCIERLPISIFQEVVPPTMFLYLGHFNGKVVRASHSVFVAFISAGKDSDQDERVLLKEQLVFYYMQRSLEGFPGKTPFDSMASGVAALVRYLPAGSPAIFYCIHSLVARVNELCNEMPSQDVNLWKNWQGEAEPRKKILELLLRIIALVDIQVLPDLMKSLATLINQLPKDGQNLVLDEIYSHVAESDDVTRKPMLVSWLQSLSYLCSQGNSTAVSGGTCIGENSVSAGSKSLLGWTGISARL